MLTIRSPFVKWAGGKRRLVPFIAEHLALPAHRLVEPFAGGAAVSLALADQVDNVWLNDVNVDLMGVYTQLRDAPDQYIDSAQRLFTPATNDPDTYYRLRDEFNTTASEQRKAALFLYLNRHGFNGLCRYNSSGQFNVPYGRYKNPYFPEEELRAAVPVVQRAHLTSVDFEEVLAQCGQGDVVYCDPPYVPLTATASFTDYAAGGFDMADQKRLVKAAEAACARGALVAISNHDTQLTKDLYRGARCYYRTVRRMISSDGQNRNEVGEVLAVFGPAQPRQVVHC